jgi:ABC-type transport system involved in multi-copper enzyme maturation permease subunit
MFAVLFLERDPLGLQVILPGLWYYVQTVGGFAMVGILAWLVCDWARRRPADRDKVPPLQRQFVMVCIVLAALVYALTLPLRAYEFIQFCFGSSFYPSPNGGAVTVEWKPGVQAFESWCLFIGGLLAMTVVLLPFLLNVLALRWRRIFALAGLSFKEALRRRVLWAFSALLLVFLFGSWFVSGRAKPEDQLRTYVQLVFWAMTPLLLFTAVLLAAFSIPADIRNQTIHTVLTKPVQRFEVYLGRVLGFTGLMTLVLLVLSGLSLLYVLRGVDPDSAAESLKARAPLFGALSFENTGDAERGINVGEEWGYRSYITAPDVSTGGGPPQAAIWRFDDLPSGLAGRDKVRCEFNFAIYRAYKGEKEGRGISCAFAFRTWRFDPARLDEYRKRRKEERNNLHGRSEMEVDNTLAKEFGYYEIDSFPVENFHTMSRDLPGGLFANAAERDDARRRTLDQIGAKPAPLEVRVRCLDRQEYVGMARYDLYLRQDSADPAGDARAFAINFLKGSVGLWMRLVLIIGVATALSTYLSNVISLLAALALYFGGLFREFIASVIVGKNVGGGPLQSFLAVVGRQVGVGPQEQPPHVVSDGKWCRLLQHDTSHLEASVGRYVFGAFDPAFRWVMSRVFDLIPDVDRFDLTLFVSEGFDVSAGQLLTTLLLLFGYLLVCAVVAFYLLKWREVASNT